MLEGGENKEVHFVFCLIQFYCVVIADNYFFLIFCLFLALQYLPIEGLAAFNKATADLLLGADNPVIKEGRVCLISF